MPLFNPSALKNDTSVNKKSYPSAPASSPQPSVNREKQTSSTHTSMNIGLTQTGLWPAATFKPELLGPLLKINGRLKNANRNLHGVGHRVNRVAHHRRSHESRL